MKPAGIDSAQTLILPGGIGLILVTTFVAPGCGTIANQQSKHPRIYGGVRLDLHEVKDGSGVPARLVTLDIPFSAVGDTLTLPFDAFSQTNAATNSPTGK